MLDRVFSNRYRLVEKIGIGGMAEVYKATDEVLGRSVAVKVMLPQYAADPTFAARFKQEAQSAANLQSPYIVNIYDWGQDATDNTYYIVMEYVRGTDLKTAIQERGAINQRKVAEIGSQVCAALSVAHGYDIIHRDIKPHNIMVQPDGNSKVMDFGIARASGSSMTQTGSVLGTAYYISPEQAQGRQLTSATDLYSLGVVLYEAVTGTVPFEAADAVAVALKQVNELPLPPSQINPDIDPELEAIIMRALEKDPQNRYATAEQMRVALNNYLAGRPVDTDVDPAAQTRVLAGAAALPVIGSNGVAPPTHTAVMPNVGGSAGAPMNARSASRAKEAEAKKKRQRMIIIGVIASVAALIGIVIFVVAMTSGGNKIEVPDLVGKTQAEAKAELEALDLKYTISMEASATVEKDRVISTDPSRNTKVDKGSSVALVVSSGPEAPKMVKVPDLSKMTPAQAQDALTKLKLLATRGEARFDANIAVDLVCAQDPPANTEVAEGTTVTIYLSKGKDKPSVPVVSNGQYTADEAKAAIEEAGFVFNIGGYEDSDTVPAGNVISQDPPGAANLERGQTVTVIVSNGPSQVEIPSVVGLSKSDAETKLREAGFSVTEGTAIYSPSVPKGYVISQNPTGTAAKGAVIAIVLSLGPEPAPTPDE